MTEDELSSHIIKAAIKVHRILGPGLLESVYEKVLAYDLRKSGFTVRNQVPIKINYEDIVFDEGFRGDLIVEDKVIVEIKSVKALEPVFYKQVLTYLRFSGKKLGLLLNFNMVMLKAGIKRVVLGL